MGSKTSTAHVVITMDGKQALDAMNSIQAKAKEVRKELEQMELSGQQGTDDYKKKHKELQMLERAIRQNRKAYIDLGDVVNKLEKTSLLKLQKALKETRRQMNALDPDELARKGKNYRTELHKLQVIYQKIDNQIGEVTGQWKRQDGAIMSVIKRLTAYVAVYGSFNFIKNQLSSMVSKNLEFSDTLADIRKTTGLSTKTVMELSNAINTIDTRTSVQELHNLAFEAGRLGIGGGGADAVLGFVRAANQINVALGEDLGQDAIVQLAKMNDVMGNTATMGVEKALLATGSAINLLSQSSTASGQFMSDYAMRLSGIATQAHMTTDELLGLAAASDATGQEVEVSATAMNKFVVQLQTHYKTVAKAAGVNEQMLHDMLTMGKTTDAVVMVLEALNQKGGLSMLAPLMKDLGSDGARLTASLSTLASNIGIVKDQIDLAREAFAEGTSVTNEYNIKNETAAAIMQRMANSWEKMFVNAQQSGVLRDLAQQLYDVSNSIQKNEAFLTTLNFAMQTLIFLVKSLIEMIPALFVFYSASGIVKLISSFGALGTALRNLRIGFGAVAAGATTATGATRGFAVAWRGLSALMKSNVFLLAASAIIALVAHLSKVKNEMTDMERSMDNLNKGFRKFETNSHAAAMEADVLFTRLKNTKKGTQEYKDLLKQINDQYRDYLPNQLTEKSRLEDIATAQETVNEKLRQALALKARNQAMDEISQQYSPKMAETLQEMQDIYDKYNVGGAGRADTRFLVQEVTKLYAKGNSANQIYSMVTSDLYNTKLGTKQGRSAQLMKPGEGILYREKDDLQTLVWNYIANYINQEQAVAAAKKKYDPLIGDYAPKVTSGAPYKIIEDETKKNEKANREALAWARDEYNAVMASIAVYYEQQQQVLAEMRKGGKLTPAQFEQRTKEMARQQKQTEIDARAALHNDPGAQTAWALEVARMEADTISKSERNEAAIKNIKSKDLQKIGSRLRLFGEAQDDGIWKQLEEDKTALLKEDVKLMEEVQAILLKYDFTGKVTDEYIAAMEKLKIFFPQITDEVKAGTKTLTDSARDGMADIYALYPKLFDIDINTDEGLKDFREMIEGASHLGERYAKLSEANVRLLYYQSLEYGDAMVEAEKKARQRNQKIADERWRQMGGKEKEAGFDRKQGQMERVTSLYSRVGLASENVATDMEVELYKARMEAALEYRDVVVQTGGDIESANAKVTESINALSNVLVEKTMSQMETLKSFIDPLEEMGEGIGEALAIDDAAERAEALSDVMWSAADAVADATKQMIVNWVKQKIQHAITNKAMEAQEAAHQATQTGIVVAGEQAKATAVEASESQISITKATHSAENITTQATETSADAALGIAQGAAKTIGELGWWGIPLVGVISALIGGLLSWAMGQVKGSKGTTKGVSSPTKLVTGMLTYDGGNVQQVLGSDGRIYQARVGGIHGSGIVTSPTLTNVNGQTAIVGERGPELVIGRETTRMMMENAPELLASLVQFDKMYSGRGFRTFDRGNLSSLALPSGTSSEEAEQAMMERILTAVNIALTPTLTSVGEAMAANARAQQSLVNRLNKPIPAQINKRQLIDEVADGLLTDKRTGRNKNVTRLFG